MTNLIKFDGFDNSEIRVTDDGRYSVYDVIKFCGQKNPWQPWKRLCDQYSELLTKSEEYKFAGKGGAAKQTPVASRENILYIIGLLPGAVGKAYREESAKVFLQYLDASPELAESIIDRATPEDLRRIERRLQGKKIRILFTTELGDRGVTEGWQFGKCTNAIYQPILGGTASEVKKQRNLPVKANIRDSMSTLELSAVSFAEDLAIRDMRATNAQGFNQCHKVTQDAAQRVRKAMD